MNIRQKRTTRFSNTNFVPAINLNNNEERNLYTFFVTYLDRVLGDVGEGQITEKQLYEKVVKFINESEIKGENVPTPSNILRLAVSTDRDNLQEASTYNRTFSMITRPNISGEALKLLQEWGSENLFLSEASVGELASNLYNDYREYLSQVKKIEITGSSESHGTVISRKKFNESFLYVQQIINKNTFVTLSHGRKSSITGVELKRSKAGRIQS